MDGLGPQRLGGVKLRRPHVAKPIADHHVVHFGGVAVDSDVLGVALACERVAANVDLDTPGLAAPPDVALHC